MSGSVLAWIIAACGVGAAASVWKSENRWLISLAGLFLWANVAFALSGYTGSWQTLAVLLVYLFGLVGVLWILETFNLRRILIAQAVGLGLGELFVVLEFWPIDPISRSLILVVFGLVLFELVQLRENGSLSWRSIRGAVGLSVAVLIAIVLSSQWLTY